MTYSVIYQKINDQSFPPGYYYAHIPVLDLTRHGLGIEGARSAAIDVVKLWVRKKRQTGNQSPKNSQLCIQP